MPHAHPVARWLYNGALRVLTPLYLRRLRRRAQQERAYAERLDERLAQPQPDRRFARPASADAPRVWLHAVSLGETKAAAPLVEALRAQWPAMQLLLTCSTATGLAAGQGLLKPGDMQTWLPFDTASATQRFFAHWQPSLGVVMETEIWPNLMAAAQDAGVPVVLANARLSERSLARGHRWRALLRPALQSFDVVLAQSSSDAERFRSAGAQRVELSGNLKFDIAPQPKLVTRGRAWRLVAARPIVALAVSRESEEAALLQAWRALDAPRPLLLIVPRHPQRFDEVASLVMSHGLGLARRSQWGDAPSASDCAADVWLGDSMGEMPLYYGAADCALLGGSFAELGGQNLIEAAACGCPIVMGPHTYNFAEASELALAAQAAVRVQDMDEGVRRAVVLARDVERRAWVERALDFAASHRGATDRMAKRIAQVWRESSRR